MIKSVSAFVDSVASEIGFGPILNYDHNDVRGDEHALGGKMYDGMMLKP